MQKKVDFSYFLKKLECSDFSKFEDRELYHLINQVSDLIDFLIKKDVIGIFAFEIDLAFCLVKMFYEAISRGLPDEYSYDDYDLFCLERVYAFSVSSSVYGLFKFKRKLECLNEEKNSEYCHFIFSFIEDAIERKVSQMPRTLLS